MAKVLTDALLNQYGDPQRAELRLRTPEMHRARISRHGWRGAILDVPLSRSAIGRQPASGSAAIRPRTDRQAVAPIVRLLEAHGWSVWWDTRINPGQVWDETIEHELRSARCVVVVWSPVSVLSRWVRSEAGEALERGVLIPISVKGAVPPLGFRLIQTVDLSRWEGERLRRGARVDIGGSSDYRSDCNIRCADWGAP